MNALVQLDPVANMHYSIFVTLSGQCKGQSRAHLQDCTLNAVLLLLSLPLAGEVYGSLIKIIEISVQCWTFTCH